MLAIEHVHRRSDEGVARGATVSVDLPNGGPFSVRGWDTLGRTVDGCAAAGAGAADATLAGGALN